MSGAAVIIRQNWMVRRFHDAGATSPATACSPRDLGVRASFIFRRLVDRGVFIEVGGGRYYVDVVRFAEFGRSRRRIIFISMGILLIGMILIIAASS